MVGPIQVSAITPTLVRSARPRWAAWKLPVGNHDRILLFRSDQPGMCSGAAGGSARASNSEWHQLGRGRRAALHLRQYGEKYLAGTRNQQLGYLVHEKFPLTENKSLQFQTNFFNAFNHAQFFGPTANGGAVGGSSNFGEVTTDSTGSSSPYYRGPRIIQFALRLAF